MGPVKPVAPMKGQSNLFSFFAKPSPGAQREAATASLKTPISISEVKKKEETTSVQRSSGGTSSADVDSPYVNSLTPSFAHSQESFENNNSKVTQSDNDTSGSMDCVDDDEGIVRKKKPVAAKRGRMILDDDDDDDDASAPRAVKKGPAPNDDEDEVWNGEDTDESSGDDSDGYSDEDSFISEDSEDRQKSSSLSRKRPAAKASAKASAKAAPSKRAAPTKAGSNAGLATPKTPKSGANMSDLFDKCNAAASSNCKGVSGGFAEVTSSAYATSPADVAAAGKHAIVLPEGVVGQGSHEHNFWSWLKKDRKDKNMRVPSHPEFNPRSLHVPQAFQREATPAMAQWWAFKAENMDTVLFFKVGKFYELFHMDADVGMSELDLIYMKGAKAHSGFPEISYGKFASALVSKGYRVARVEQTETPDGLKERNDKGGTKDKVVRREMCSVMSKGTRTYCHLDDAALLGGADPSSSSSILYCITEDASSVAAAEGGEEGGCCTVPEYGVCCIDTVIGSVTLAQFQDDTQRSRLRTMMSKHLPSEVVLHHGKHSAETVGAFRLLAPRANVEMLRGSEMPTAEEAVEMLARGRYFPEGGSPPVLQAVLAGMEHGGATALLMSALGGALWQLRRSLIDYEILSLGKVFAYVPSDDDAPTAALAAQPVHVASDDEASLPNTMTIDATALHNLEILVNNFDHSEKGSLWAFVNRCKTQFGRRLLREWLCHPLFRPRDIATRRGAVEQLLVECGSDAEEARGILKGVPDLERLLLRVHTNGLKKRGGEKDHPDDRAVMYENNTYNAAKIKTLADVLGGFESVLKVNQIMRSRVENASGGAASPLLVSIVVDRFPAQQMDGLLKHYRQLFDEKQAKKDGIIKPRPGVDKEFDDAKEEVAGLEKELEEYLRQMKRDTGISDLKYFGSIKDRYQIEVPMASCGRVPRDWATKSQKKTHRRYRTAAIERILARLDDAEARVVLAQNDTLRRIFEKFDANRNVWSDAVVCTAQLDALMSLALVSATPNYTWPSIARRGESSALLNIQNGRHPMLEAAIAARGGAEYIPNSTVLGGATKAGPAQQFAPKLMLLSGPNMGGKSTLLRQTCLITILAQIGCKVPAETCKMTPVDRIFTRVGASDRILAGQSTFFVELAETATMLHHATPDSLGILDELGRGTATFDGTAIAHAVVDHLVKRTQCRTLFATHYHSLIEDWTMDPRVRLCHMACLVDGAASTQSDVLRAAGGEEVTFLYRLGEGCSPRSYGINVARLARLPDDVIALAVQQSQLFEDRVRAGGDNCGRHSHAAAYFEKLVSLAGSELGDSEFVYVAQELWNRFKSSPAAR